MSLSFNLDEQLHYFHQELKSYPSLSYRKSQLQNLGKFLEDHEEALIKAVQADLGRPEAEVFWGELAPIHQEIKLCLSQLPNWMKPQAKPRKWLSPVHWDAKVETFYQPRGLSLIIGPWNYPIQLVLLPLVNSIAAGNLNTLKPSEYAPACAEILEKKIPQYFSSSALGIVNGPASLGAELVQKNFDVVFFTGGAAIAKDIMRLAAHRLPQFIFELGGKCPVILDDQIENLDVALRRILWGKMLNAGQTCVSPDFLCIPRHQFDLVKSKIIEMFNQDFSDPESYARIINPLHFERLKNLLNQSEVLWAGPVEEKKLKMGLHILSARSEDAPAMKEEIFGPLLPILTYDSKEEVFNQLVKMQKPLAVYYFGEDQGFFDRLKTRTQSGALLRNDVVIHLSHDQLPFGGIGESGSRAYHGFYGFEAFSHLKAVESRSLRFDFKWRYSNNLKKMPRFLRRFL